MADSVMQAIATKLTSLGYVVKQATQPALRQWDTVPCVILAAGQREDIKWLSYCSQGMKHRYSCVYVDNNGLNTNINANVDTFKMNVIHSFKNKSSFAAVPAVYNAKVNDKSDYDLSLLPAGYTYAAIDIVVSLTI